MPTKVQAKTAIDNAGVAIKADIDNILPTGVNITNGQISFSPSAIWSISMDAAGVAATADAWLATIQTNLTAASRSFIVRRSGRRGEDTVKNIIISTTLATYFINNAS
jgi:hypothetical protein